MRGESLGVLRNHIYMAGMADDYTLYLLMRKDMASLNHMGKAIAQGAHAANHAAYVIGKGDFGPEAMRQFSEWEKATTQGFGTTIVLGRITDWGSTTSSRTIDLLDIQYVVDSVIKKGFAAGVTHDPTYPLHDGDTIHLIPCDTCGWVFGSKAELSPFLQRFSLHPASVDGFI